MAVHTLFILCHHFTSDLPNTGSEYNNQIYKPDYVHLTVSRYNKACYGQIAGCAIKLAFKLSFSDSTEHLM